MTHFYTKELRDLFWRTLMAHTQYLDIALTSSVASFTAAAAPWTDHIHFVFNVASLLSYLILKYPHIHIFSPFTDYILAVILSEQVLTWSFRLQGDKHVVRQQHTSSTHAGGLYRIIPVFFSSMTFVFLPIWISHAALWFDSRQSSGWRLWLKHMINMQYKWNQTDPESRLMKHSSTVTPWP